MADRNERPAHSASAKTNAAQQTVSVRVLPQGAGRVFTGEAPADTGGAAPTYARGVVFAAELDVAAALEARGLVEIQP